MTIRSVFAALLLGVSALAAFAGSPLSAAEFSAPQKAELQAIIKDYLLQNPEILRDAMVELDRRQKAKEAEAQRSITADPASKLYTSAHQAIIGNPTGSVTLVEFFDYNCGYCKKALSDLSNLMKADPNLKVVLKDYPILTPSSLEAAQVAGAVQRQFQGDRFWQFHQKLLSMHGLVGKQQALDVAQDMGADMAKLAIDMKDPALQTGLEENMQVASALNLSGTPSYVLGQDVVVGAVGYDELKTKLDNTHKCGKASC